MEAPRRARSETREPPVLERFQLVLKCKRSSSRDKRAAHSLALFWPEAME